MVSVYFYKNVEKKIAIREHTRWLFTANLRRMKHLMKLWRESVKKSWEVNLLLLVSGMLQWIKFFITLIPTMRLLLTAQ
jgi:hypothetical protein